MNLQRWDKHKALHANTLSPTYFWLNCVEDTNVGQIMSRGEQVKAARTRE